MKKVAIILSNINKALAFEWISARLRNDFDLHFILLYPGTSELEIYLREQGIKAYPIAFTGKKDLVKSAWEIRKILKSQQIQIVHAHLLDAGLSGLFAAMLAGVRKRIYTRHHATSHHIYHPHAVRYDRIINRMATHLVATSENVRNVLISREHVNPDKIMLIHHGFDLELFANPEPYRVGLLKEKYNPSGRSPVVGVISRYIELKGIQYTIKAFQTILRHHPQALLILANASGKYKPRIDELLSELPRESYLEIQFENELHNLYRLFDVHVHVPIDEHSEAFGQTYVEALASGIPSVFTLSGVAPEFIVNNRNARVVPFRDPEAIAGAIEEILKNDDLRNRMTSQGKKDIANMFSIGKMVASLKKLYEA